MNRAVGPIIQVLLKKVRGLPKKIRELKAILKKAGFSEKSGKGSHTKWLHPLYPGRITLSGKNSRDAKPYQEKEISEAVRIVSQLEGQE